jgi:hypothetical protein
VPRALGYCISAIAPSSPKLITNPLQPNSVSSIF